MEGVLKGIREKINKKNKRCHDRWHMVRLVRNKII